tara:strand:+ start:31 stop:201 length:171 start_codon:yes stop_codon:yes gene_type:complete
MMVTATRKLSGGKKSRAKEEKVGLTMHKHKTACDARGFVCSFLSEGYILDIYQTER